jgi:hypothetical protein
MITAAVRKLAVCLLVACSHPPPPAPPPVEKPVNQLADVADTWTTSDDLDWGYFLKISNHDFMLTIDRGKMGRCTQHGTLAKGSTGPKFQLDVDVDECHRDRANGPLYVTFPHFDGKTLTVEELDGDQKERRVFKRSPNASME